MQAKINDVIKESKTYLTAGLGLLLIWALLQPTHIAHRETRDLTREFAAYLLTKEAISGNRQALYVHQEDSTLPKFPEGLTYTMSVNRPGVLSACEWNTHLEPGGGNDPHRQSRYSGSCMPLTIHSPERGNAVITLRFKSIDSPPDLDVPLLADVRAADTSLPFHHFSVALVRKLTKPSYEAPDVPDPYDPASYPDEEWADQVRLSHDALFRDYELIVFQRDALDLFRSGGGDEELPKASRARRLATESSHAARDARAPRDWRQLKAIMAYSFADATELDQLKLNSPVVQRLFSQYIHEDGAHDVAGFKVPTSLAPWLFAGLLALISCLLVGLTASLRRASSIPLTEDVGWVLVQNHTTYGNASRLAAWTLIGSCMMLAAVCVAMTCADITAADPQEQWPLIALLVAILIFTNNAWENASAQRALATINPEKPLS